jgi:hypothetical protein
VEQIDDVHHSPNQGEAGRNGRVQSAQEEAVQQDLPYHAAALSPTTPDSGDNLQFALANIGWRHDDPLTALQLKHRTFLGLDLSVWPELDWSIEGENVEADERIPQSDRIDRLGFFRRHLQDNSTSG